MARYRDNTFKTAPAIAQSILEHCLWYFVRAGSAPNIHLTDEGEVISLQDLYEATMHSKAVSETVPIKAQRFEFIHVKLHGRTRTDHSMSLCADHRLVSEEKLSGRIPRLHGRLSDKDGEFMYTCYVSSPYLDECARPERTGFNLVEDAEDLFKGSEISLPEIRQRVFEATSNHLNEHLAESRERTSERVEQFVNQKAPRYRPILARIAGHELNVGPDSSDKELDLALHKKLSELEAELLEEGHELMLPAPAESHEEYHRRLEEYLSKAEDIKRSDLASYVSHRKVILDLLESAIHRSPEGKYKREDLLRVTKLLAQIAGNKSGCNA